jgi:tetratricopeptide (TPR) repeat protein
VVRRFAGAQADLDKALALSPGDANVLHRSAILLAVLGKLPAAIAREEQALALDPLSAEICMSLRGDPRYKALLRKMNLPE